MNNKLLIFGGSGFLGNAIIEHDFRSPEHIISFARGEAKQKELKKKFPRINIEIGNIQNKKDVKNVIIKYKPEMVIIASALKDISICQQFPNECIKTNVLGVQNVLEVINDYHMPLSTCYISTDKAVEPKNIYGTSKYLSEQLIQAQSDKSNNLSNFYSVRYGNVLGSTGSLFPLIKEQLKSGKLTITNPNMTRFNILAKDAVEAIFFGYSRRIKGTIIPEGLQSFKLGELIEVLHEKYKFTVEMIGEQPFEKQHEILISLEERYTLCENKYLILNKHGGYSSKIYSSSHNLMSKYALKGLVDAYI